MEYIIVILLGVIAWNIKQGFNMIDEKLDEIIKERKKRN